MDRYSRRAMSALPSGIGASVGIASYPDEAGDSDTLLEKADQMIVRQQTRSQTPEEGSVGKGSSDP